MKALLLALLSTASFVAGAQQPVVLKLDHDHLQMQRADGSQPKSYSFSPTAVVVLDSTGYNLPVSPKLEGKPPNSIQLVLGDAEKYSTLWKPGQSRHTLSATTLTASPGSAPFKGFPKGREGVVAVGRLEGNNFYVSWVGMFRVQ